MAKLTRYLIAIVIVTCSGMSTWLAFPSVLVRGSVIAFAAPSPETMQQREARLIKGAQKEGKLVMWSAGDVRELEETLAKFTQRYPFIKTEVWRAGTTARHQKIMAEARAGLYNLDIATSDVELIQELKEAGLLKRYDWPNTRNWSPDHKDPQGYWIARNIAPVVVAYNTKLITPREAPKTWDDLLNPKWKGAISIGKDGGDWLLMLWAAWGKEKTIAYLKGLVKNNPVLGSRPPARTEMLAAGAFKIDMHLFLNRILEYQEKGAPLDWVRTDPVLTRGTPIFIAERAPNPNAAMLYADWYTSLEGGEAFNAASLRLTPHPGIKSQLSEALKGHKTAFTPPEIAVNRNEANKIFEELFWKK